MSPNHPTIRLYINTLMKNALEPVTISLDASYLELLQQLSEDQGTGLDSWLAHQIESAWRAQFLSSDEEAQF